MSKQIGTGQPHIYPVHISSISIQNYSKEKSNKFNNLVSPFFKKINLNKKQNTKLRELKSLLLAKMTKVEVVKEGA